MFFPRRPMPRERSSLLPLMPTLMPGTGTMPMHGPSMLPPPGWGPPPSYDDAVSDDRPSRHLAGQRSGLCGSSIQPTHSFAGTSSGGFTGGFFNNRSSASFAFHGGHHPPPRRLRLVTSHSENSFRGNADGLMCPHPFSPTITSVDPASIFKQHAHVNQHHHHHNPQHHHHHHHHRHNPSSNCSVAHHNNDFPVGSSNDNSPPSSSAPVGRINFRSLSQSQVLQRSTTEEDDECCMSHSCQGNSHHLHHHHKLPQSSSFLTNPSARNSEFSITSLSMPDNSSMSITMKSSNDIPLNDNSGSQCCNLNHGGTTSSLVDDDTDFASNNNECHIEETACSDQEISLTSNCTTSGEAIRLGGGRSSSGGGIGGPETITSSSSTTGATGLTSIITINGKICTHGAPPITTSEPKIINANKNNSFNAGQVDSNSVINSDTDIILNKKSLEFWGSLKKHKNFAYYGGGGSSTSRRRRKDKNKSSLSKISSLPCSPFLNMRRKLFGPGGKSLECVQNLNYNFSYSMAPIEAANVSSVASNKNNQNQVMINNNATSDEFSNGDYDDSRDKDKVSTSSVSSAENANLDQRRNSSTRNTPKKSSKEIFTRPDFSHDEVNNISSSAAEVRPELA